MVTTVQVLRQIQSLSGFGLGDGTWTVPDANNPSAVIPWVYNDEGYNYRAAQSGANANKTTTVFVSGDYELADELTFFAELSFHDGFVQGNQAPPGTDTGWYGDNVSIHLMHLSATLMQTAITLV